MAAPPVVELGFVQEAESLRLLSPHFPSKAGGRPAWLGEVGVPGPESLQCGLCQKPLAFLLQVYAPCPGSFHRTVFLFCCRSPQCHRVGETGCFKVFRNQLPRKNDTYSYDPPPEVLPSEGSGSPSFRLKCGLGLCRVCGCLGPKQCSKCHKVSYCSKEHQLLDWKAQHKKLCSEQLDLSNAALPDHNFLFPEYEIVTEPEELESDSENDDDEEQPGLDKAADGIMSGEASLSDNLTSDDKDLEAMARHESTDDVVFNLFKKRIAAEPDQVLRYCRGGEPLWMSAQNVPAANDIPDCQCGAKRVFEFQVMPQLLNHLKVDSLGESIDWGILAVFTCINNCNAEKDYLVEFLWKQDVVDSAL
ncbi:programmed cell death protein 2 [Pelobates fuscus]|uniref:programmed cell death protein 2 n=1 Tax=Pelobates fuscus TaxID=191477 RepID=UPI002FE44982